MSNTETLSQIDPEGMRELLTWKIEDTAEWRSAKSKQYPDDIRNLDAVKHLEELKSSMRNVSVESLSALENVCEALLSGDSFSANEKFDDTVSEQLRWVGFGSKPESAQQFVDYLIESLRT